VGAGLFLVHGERHRDFAAQGAHTIVGDAQVVRVLVGHLEQSELYHLRYVCVPLRSTEVAPGTVGLDAVKSLGAQIRLGRAPQYVGEHVYADATAGAYDGAGGFLKQDGAVEAFVVTAAYVAVAAVVLGDLAEVAEQHTASAHPGVGVALHPVQFLGVDGGAPALIDEMAAHDHIL